MVSQVENLPKECRSDDALRVYFARLFGPQSIVQALAADFFFSKKDGEIELWWEITIFNR